MNIFDAVGEYVTSGNHIYLVYGAVLLFALFVFFLLGGRKAFIPRTTEQRRSIGRSLMKLGFTTVICSLFFFALAYKTAQAVNLPYVQFISRGPQAMVAASAAVLGAVLIVWGLLLRTSE